MFENIKHNQSNQECFGTIYVAMNLTGYGILCLVEENYAPSGEKSVTFLGLLSANRVEWSRVEWSNIAPKIRANDRKCIL